jgi:hypothetical protein
MLNDREISNQKLKLGFIKYPEYFRQALLSQAVLNEPQRYYERLFHVVSLFDPLMIFYFLM